jgi:hypothetical protein
MENQHTLRRILGHWQGASGLKWCLDNEVNQYDKRRMEYLLASTAKGNMPTMCIVDDARAPGNEQLAAMNSLVVK